MCKNTYLHCTYTFVFNLYFCSFVVNSLLIVKKLQTVKNHLFLNIRSYFTHVHFTLTFVLTCIFCSLLIKYLFILQLLSILPPHRIFTLLTSHTDHPITNSQPPSIHIHFQHNNDMDISPHVTTLTPID